MLQARVPGKVLDVDVEIIAFDVFGTLVDWHTSIAAALAEVGGRAGIDADWAVLASAWRALPALLPRTTWTWRRAICSPWPR